MIVDDDDEALNATVECIGKRGRLFSFKRGEVVGGGGGGVAWG